MKKENLICILCPNGCELEAELEDAGGIRVTAVRGALCPRGSRWATLELEHPVRTVTTSVLCSGGILPLVSVKTDRAIPLGRVRDIMRELSDCRVEAPVFIGDLIALDPCGIECRVIATRHNPLKELP